MRVCNDDGIIFVSIRHLKNADAAVLYLDIIHELVHVRQHFENKDLYDKSVNYIDRPTEIEAYKITVKEARRIGMKRKEIEEYLKVEWIGREDFKRFLISLGIDQL